MKNPRGYYEEIKITKNWEITYVKWLDNKAVNIVSFLAKANPVLLVSHFDSKTKKAIDVLWPDIKCYNASMGGVDLADQLISLYRISIKSKQFYHRLIFHSSTC